MWLPVVAEEYTTCDSLSNEWSASNCPLTSIYWKLTGTELSDCPSRTATVSKGLQSYRPFYLDLSHLLQAPQIWTHQESFWAGHWNSVLTSPMAWHHTLKLNLSAGRLSQNLSCTPGTASRSPMWWFIHYIYTIYTLYSEVYAGPTVLQKGHESSGEWGSFHVSHSATGIGQQLHYNSVKHLALCICKPYYLQASPQNSLAAPCWLGICIHFIQGHLIVLKTHETKLTGHTCCRSAEAVLNYLLFIAESCLQQAQSRLYICACDRMCLKEACSWLEILPRHNLAMEVNEAKISRHYWKRRVEQLSEFQGFHYICQALTWKHALTFDDCQCHCSPHNAEDHRDCNLWLLAFLDTSFSTIILLICHAWWTCNVRWRVCPDDCVDFVAPGLSLSEL